MKRGLKNLLAFSVKATDGEEGVVKDFLFDEDKWIARYLEVDLGSLFKGRKVLIEKSFLDKPDWNDFMFPIKLTKKEIENAPELKEHLPVSGKYEEEFNKHYRLVNYWDLPVAAIGTMYPPRPIKVPTKEINEKNLDTNLRSYNEVENYRVHATDGTFGHVCDLIIDDEDWQVVYVIIDTSNWLPWSKKVMIPVNCLEEICYVKSEIEVNLSVETIKNSPEYNETIPVESDYERSLYEFYTRTL